MKNKRIFSIVVLMIYFVTLVALSPRSSTAAPPSQEPLHWDQLLYLSPGSIDDVAFSPDGTLLAVAGQGGVRLCTPDLNIINVLAHGDGNFVHAVAWSPDGTQIATGEEKLDPQSADHYPAMRIWDVENTQYSVPTMGTLQEPHDFVQAIAWSPDGEWIAGGFRGKVEIWRAKTRRLETRLIHASPVASLAWSPDGTQLAISGSIWNTKTWERRGQFDGEGTIRWSPDGTRLAAVDANNTLRIWDAATLESLITLTGHNDSINALAWSPDGTQAVSGSDDGTVRVWDAATGDTIAVLPQGNPVLAVAWSPDSQRIVSGITGGTPLDAPDVMATAWDAATFEPVDRLHGAGYTESVMWAPDGIRLASAEGSMIKVWDSHTGKLLRALDGYETHTFRIRWSPNGTLLAVKGFADTPVWIWDTTSGERLAILGESGQKTDPHGSWSPDSTRYVHSQADGSIVIFDATSGEPVMNLPEHDPTNQQLGDIEWSPDGKRLAASAFDGNDSSVQIWDPTTGQLLDELPGYGSVRWSPDGTRLAYSSEDGLHLYDMDTGTQVVIETDSSTVAWSPDGQHIAAWRDAWCSQGDQVQIWDTHSGERLAVLDGGVDAWIDFVQWSPYGVNRSTCGGPNYIAYSPDGTRWAIGYGYGIEVWRHGEE